LERCACRIACRGDDAGSIAQLIQKVSDICIVYFAAKLVISGELTVGQMVAFRMLAGRVSQPVLRLVQMWQDFQQTSISIKRLGDIFNSKPEPTMEGTKTRLPAIEGTIRFDKVRFRYRPEGAEVIQNMSFLIKPNTVVGIGTIHKRGKAKACIKCPIPSSSSFLGQLTKSKWRNYDYVASLTQQNSRVLYYYERLNNKKRIHINERWVSYMIKNEAILKGWIQNELIQYLQKRNPNVPGIPFKIRPPEKRDLKVAIKFWNTMISNYEITDVYTGKVINEESMSQYGKIAIDHFMPWSYVASDEMWNLTPTFTAINSSKSNYLPGQESDRSNLARQQFVAKCIASDNKNIGRLYEAFKNKHINGTDMEDI